MKNDPAGFNAAVEALERLASRAEIAGVILAVENWLSAGDSLKILGGVGSPAVHVYYDVENSQDAGHPVFDEIRHNGWLVLEGTKMPLGVEKSVRYDAVFCRASDS